MPTYEYACLSCGHHIEVFQRFSDEPLTTCGLCGGPLRKVFHPAGILFKGSGFYATDSRTSRTGGGRSDSDSSETSRGESGKGKASKAEKGKGEPAIGSAQGGDKPAGDRPSPSKKEISA